MKLARRLYQHAAVFLNWWFSELISIVRLSSSRFLPSWKGDLTALVTRTHVSLVDLGTGSNEPFLQIQRPGSSGDAPPTIIDPAMGSTLQERRVRIIVDPELAFVRRVRLPLAAMPHLASAVQLQLPKWLPLKAHKVRSDFRVSNVDAEAATVEVELAAIRCGDIEPLEAALRHWNLEPYTIQLGRADDASPRFNLASSKSGSRPVAFTRADAALTVGAGLLTVAVFLTFLAQTYLAQLSLQQALTRSTAEAAKMLDQRQRLTTRLETLSTLSAVEQSPTAAAILSEVTQRVGHESWVTTFELEGDTVRLSGWAPDSAAVMAALSASKLLAHVELRSSQADGGTSKGERFEIKAHIKAST